MLNKNSVDKIIDDLTLQVLEEVKIFKKSRFSVNDFSQKIRKINGSNSTWITGYDTGTGSRIVLRSDIESL